MHCFIIHDIIYSTDVIYQLSLDIFNDECKSWIHSDTEEKIEDINQKIAIKMNNYSQCGIDGKYRIENDQHAFRCQTAQDGHVVYNVHLLQAAAANITVIGLVACMNSWVTNTGSTIVVKGVQYPLTKACSGVLLDSDSDPFICPWLQPTPSPTSKSKLGVGEGIGIGLGIGIVIIAIIVGVLVIIRWIVNRYNR
jgi:hypothetical protein